MTDVIGFSNGYNEGDEWVGVFILRDGRYLFLAAGCDNTGWDCSSSGHSWVASDYETLFTFGMGADMRERMHLSERFDLDATREVRAATGCSTVAVFVNGDRMTVQIEAWYEHCERADAIECVSARLREVIGDGDLVARADDGRIVKAHAITAPNFAGVWSNGEIAPSQRDVAVKMNASGRLGDAVFLADGDGLDGYGSVTVPTRAGAAVYAVGTIVRVENGRPILRLRSK